MIAKFGFPPALMNREQAAYYVGLSLTVFDERRRAGHIIPVDDAGRKYPREELDRYVATREEV